MKTLNDADSSLVRTLIVQAQSIVAPGFLTLGNARRILDLLNRFRISKSLTAKQATELQGLIDKARLKI